MTPYPISYTGEQDWGPITVESGDPKPNLTVVIVTLGRRPESLRLLLSQLKEQTLPRDRWELILWQKTDADMNEFDQMNKALHRTRFNAPTDVFITLGDDHEAHLLGRLRDLYFHRKGESTNVSFYINRLILDDLGAVNFNIVGEPGRAFTRLNTISETLQDLLSGVYTPL